MSVGVHDGLSQLTLRLLHQLECHDAVATLVMRGAQDRALRALSRRLFRVAALAVELWVSHAQAIAPLSHPMHDAPVRLCRERGDERVLRCVDLHGRGRYGLARTILDDGDDLPFA